MRKLLFVIFVFALALIFIKVYPGWKSEPEPITKTDTTSKPTEQPVTTDTQKSPLQILKEAQKKVSVISGYKFSRITIEKNGTATYNNTETGEEQLNPQVAHFTNSKNHEYYYDKLNIYMKKDGQWVKRVNSDGKVLVSVLFTNNVEFLLRNLGTNQEIPGITATKKDFEYIITVDYLKFKDPGMTDADFLASQKQTKTRKTELIVDANTFAPKKYSYNFETLDGTKFQSVDLDLIPYSEPITIPADVTINAKASTPASTNGGKNTTY